MIERNLQLRTRMVYTHTHTHTHIYIYIYIYIIYQTWNHFFFLFVFRAQVLTECSTPRKFEQMVSNLLLKSYQSHEEVICLYLLYYFQFIYFNWRLIQYCSGFCHTLTWISHGCTCGPHPEPPSHLPPHPIPQGGPSALALSALFHALNLDWWSISCMVIYMFQCYSLKSSHPHLLPHSPKVCVFFAVSHIVSLLPSF